MRTEVDTMLRTIGESVLVAVRQWADPRERELRKRRRARRRSIRLGTASGFTAVGAAALTVVAAPFWAVVLTGTGAAALVVPAALATKRYLRLRAKPLPAAGATVRMLPPMTSRARAPMVRLASSERSLREVLVIIDRSAPVPAEDIAETVETAESAAAALHALSKDIIALERAAKRAGAAAPELEHSVGLALAELAAGVQEYEKLLRAAARLTSPASAARLSATESATWELRLAADRLDGWAEALTELADNSRIALPAPTRRALVAGSG